ncbi:MAG: hypothetical protein JWP13_927 [Candidatus Saccharibacteria bacterium]|nr:hypothetical protein [Candidatus Saccharibacteria bacterium]
MAKKQTAGLVGVLVAAGAGYLITNTVKQKKAALNDAVGRWHTITVNVPVAEAIPNGTLPEPLNRISDMIEIDIRPTPDATGTEIAARLNATEDGIDRQKAVRKVRKALRESQMIIETGEILMPDRGKTTEPTLLNAPIRYFTNNRFGEGRL